MAYRFRLDPTDDQRRAFERAAGARRWVWNHFLARRKAVYAATGETLSVADMCRELTALKRAPETAWLAELPAQMLQQAIRDLDRAFRNFFERRARFPRFRRKKDARQSFRFPQDVRVEAGAVVLPKIGRVRMRLSQAVAGVVKSATVRREAGH
jgi:putative transposase